ncbi:MAG: hypothetical protein L0Z49_13245 [Actinobacteria bacterium]|nr:hypothetical protein [Actinomycetota bacterium]
MTAAQMPSKHDADELYRKYVRPLEKDHRGHYAGVSLQGQTIIAPTLLEAVRRATDAFGRGNNVVFKIGDKVVGQLL